MAKLTAKKASKDFIEGASASLTLSAKELNNFLAGLGVKPTGRPMRNKYRDALSQFGAYWMRRGFKRGCIELRKSYKANGKFPKKVSYNASRLFFDRTHSVKLTWK